MYYFVFECQQIQVLHKGDLLFHKPMCLLTYDSEYQCPNVTKNLLIHKLGISHVLSDAVLLLPHWGKMRPSFFAPDMITQKNFQDGDRLIIPSLGIDGPYPQQQ